MNIPEKANGLNKRLRRLVVQQEVAKGLQPTFFLYKKGSINKITKRKGHKKNYLNRL